MGAISSLARGGGVLREVAWPAGPDLCVVGFGAKAEEAHRSIMSVQQLSRNIQAEIKQYHEVGEAGVSAIGRT